MDKYPDEEQRRNQETLVPPAPEKHINSDQQERLKLMAIQKVNHYENLYKNHYENHHENLYKNYYDNHHDNHHKNHEDRSEKEYQRLRNT